jgi:hypothetical protein
MQISAIMIVFLVIVLSFCYYDAKIQKSQIQVHKTVVKLNNLVTLHLNPPSPNQISTNFNKGIKKDVFLHPVSKYIYYTLIYYLYGIQV